MVRANTGSAPIIADPEKRAMQRANERRTGPMNPTPCQKCWKENTLEGKKWNVDASSKQDRVEVKYLRPEWWAVKSHNVYDGIKADGDKKCPERQKGDGSKGYPFQRKHL